MSLTSLNQLLHLLADGHFHSGTDLGERLHMTRAAVWKQLQGIEQLGVQVHRVRGKGYRIPAGLDLLDLEAIIRHQPQLAKLFAMELLMSTASTNQVLMQRQNEGSIHAKSCLPRCRLLVVAGSGANGNHLLPNNWLCL